MTEPDAGGRRNSSLIAAGIMLSRVAGFVRQRAISHFFGVSFVTDAFSAAFRIPNLMQNLLGEGVLSASFIPVYSRLLADGREEEAGRLAGAIAGLLTVLTGVLAVIGVVFAEPLTSLIAPGLPDRTHDLTVQLLRIIAPGTGVLVLSAWCLGVLNSHRRFFLSYVAPVIWNVAQIAALLIGGLVVLRGGLGAPDTNAAAQIDLIAWLAWGTLIGGILQFAVQLPAVLRLTRGLRLSLDTRSEAPRRVLRLFGPVVAGRGVVQLLAFVDVALASLLAEGAISALFYAQQLFVLPISLFGMSVAAAELPELSSTDPSDADTVVGRLDAGLARIAFFVVPSVVVFAVLGDLVVGALFRTGAFGREDELLVWLVLLGFTVGLLSNTSSRLLQSALYGAGDARTPAKLAALRVTVAAIVGAILMLQFDRFQLVDGAIRMAGDLPAFAPLPAAVRGIEDSFRLGAVGLSIAAGASSWIEYRLLRRHLAARLGRAVRVGGGQLPRILLAALAATLVAVSARLLVGVDSPIVGGAIAVGATGVAYVSVAHRLGLSEAHALVSSGARLSRRLRRR